MATLQGQYKAAIKKGLLDQSVTEEQFVQILKNPKQRKAYYDNANQIISGAYGTYDSFSAAADEVLAAYKSQVKQPTPTQEAPQAVSTMPVGAAADSTDAAITMLMQQKDKEQKAAKEERARINAAQLPMSDDDRTREEQIRNIDATLSKVGVERFGNRMPIGDEREDVLQQQKQLEQERATLQGQRKNYMAEPTTVEEARESWIDAWSENTEEGKQAKADMEKAVLEAQNYLLEEFKKSDTFKSIYADVQGKVNRGELSVDAANKELNTRLEEAFVAENEELLNAEKNTQVQAYVKRALKADNGWLKRQEERLGEQALREALDENLDELNAAMKADYDAFAKSVGNGFGAAQAKSNYIEQQQLGVLGAAAQLLQETNTILSATKKGEEKVGSLSGEIFRHLGDKLKSIGTFGMSDTSSAMYQANVLKKIAEADAYDNPESVLDRDELVLYDAIVANMAAQIVRAENTSHLANAGKLTAEMIPFVMEIAIGKGLFSGMTKAAQRGVSRSILRSLGNSKWRRVIASQTGELLSGALESAAIAAIAPSTYKQIFQNEAKIDPTSLQLKDGKWTVGEIDQQSTGSAIWNAYRGNWREMFTETGGLTQFAAGFLKVSPLGKLIQKTPIGKLSQIMDNNFVGKMFKQTAYHGIAGELSEEWENTFYEATEAFLKADKGKKWEAFGNVYGEFVKPETQVPMLISFSLPAIFGGAVTTGQMLAINSQYKKAYNNLRDTYMKYGATEKEFEDALNELVAAQLNVPIEQYPDVIRAVAATLSGGNQAQADEFATALSAYAVADANLGAIQEKHAKKQRQVQSMIHELEAAEQRIAQDTHTNGIMYHVEVGGNPGYFVRGILPLEQYEGDEFARGTGDYIVTVRMEDGSIKQVAANQVKLLEQPQTAENAIEFERRRLTAKMNNLDRFKVGDVIYITENGLPIDEFSSRVVDVTDEGIVTEFVWNDGRVDSTTIPHDVAESGLSTSDELVEEGAESAVIEMPGGTLVTMQKTATGDWMQVAPKTDNVSLISQREFDEMLADSGAKVVGGTIMEQPSTDDVASGNGVVSEEAGGMEAPTEQPAADKPYATDEQGNPLWADMNTEQAAQALLSEVEGDKELAKQFAQAQVESAKAAVNKANKRKPQATNNLAAFKAEAQAIKQEQEVAQAELSKWENVVLAIANYKTEAEQAEEKNSSVSDKTTDTTETHEGKQDDTALLQNTTISSDKGTKNVPSTQENVQKTAEEQQENADLGEKTQTDTKKAQEDEQTSVSAEQNFASTEQKSVEQNEKTQEVGEISETVDELDAKLAAAEAETDTNPTEAQKKAENYKQGHVTLWGLPFTIENPKGSVRRGTDANGKQWEQVMNNTYGKIRRTEGVDGDHIDVFFGPNLHSEKVFVVDQRNVDTGEFDEHKVMLGFDSMQEAQDAYLSNYEEGWQGMGPVTETTMDEFKKWIESSHRKTKAFSEYKSVKQESVSIEQPKQVSVEGLFNDLKTRGRTRLSDNVIGEEPKWVTKYKQIKEQYPDAMILFRVGDFYEVYMEDANDASNILGITLTKRGEYPMAGFPFHALDTYLPKIVRAGKRVAVADNVMDEQKVVEVVEKRENLAQNLQESNNNSNFAENIENNEQDNENLQGGVGQTNAESSETLGGSRGESEENAREANDERGDGRVRPLASTLNDIGDKQAQEDYLKASDLWLAPETISDLTERELSKGKESEVYFSNDGKSVIKLVDYSVYSQSPAEFLRNRVELFNELFPETAYTIVGVTERNGKLNFVLSQPFIKGKPLEVAWWKAGIEEYNSYKPRLDEMMREKFGMENYGLDAYQNDMIRVQDLHYNNIIEGEDGQWYVVDAITSYRDDVPGKQETPEANEPAVITDALGEIKKSTDTRDGSDIWLVNPTDRVSNEEFKELKKRAKAHNGYYSSFKQNRGFLFRTEEDAIAFNRINENELTTDEVLANTGLVIDEAETTRAEAETIATEHATQRAESSVEVLEQVEQQINKVVEKIDNSLEKVNDQMMLLGYYESEGDANEWGLSKKAEKTALKDVNRIANQLARDLGVEGKIKASANIAPAGGEITFRIPLLEGRELHVCIPIHLNAGYYRLTGNYSDLYIPDLWGGWSQGSILYRVDAENRYGTNYYARGTTTYNDFLNAVRYIAKGYAPIEQQNLHGYKIGDKVLYKGKEATIYDFNDGDLRPVLDAGLAPVLYEVVDWEDISPINAEKATAEESSVAPELQTPLEKAKARNAKKQTTVAPTIGIGDLFADTIDAVQAIVEEQEQPTNNTQVYDETSRRVGSSEPTTGNVRNSDGREPIEGRSETSIQEDTRGTDRGGETEVLRDERSESRSGLPMHAIEQEQPQGEKKNTRNNHVERGVDYAPKTPKERFEANFAAIKLLKELEESGKQATKAQMKVLRKFSGWGGLGSYFPDGWVAPDSDAGKLKQLLTPEEYDAANMSRNSAYFTPGKIIDKLWDIAAQFGFKGGNILEGSAGIGEILARVPQSMNERSNIMAVEIDPITGSILKQLYPDAQVEIDGFQNVSIPNGSQDLVITNVPFVRDLRVIDKEDMKLSKRFGGQIQDFCIAKNITKLREGGLGIFIAGKSTLDNSKDLRRWIVNEANCDVVGAFRLNKDTFGGTGATADIIVVKKRVNGAVSPNAINVLDTEIVRIEEVETEQKYNQKKRVFESVTERVGLSYNQYYVEHPESMGGEMYLGFEQGDTRFGGTSAACYPQRGINQEKRLDEWVAQLGKDEAPMQTVPVTDNLKEYENTTATQGSIILNSKGEICIANRGKAEPLAVNANKVKGQSKEQVVKDYQVLKDAISNVLSIQEQGQDEAALAAAQKKLNAAYDSFVKKYGYLNKNTALSFLRNDVDFPSVAAIEKYEETETPKGKQVKVSKTDIFSKRVIGAKTEPKPTTTRDAVVLSVQQFGRLDTAKMAEWLGTNEESVRENVVRERLGFVDPETQQLQIRHEYLSGNVRQKLAYAQEHNDDGKYDSNIEELEKVIPMTIPSHLIEFSLGSTWIDPQIYADFVKEKYDVNLKYAHVAGVWSVSGRPWNRSEKNRAAGVRSEMLDMQVFGDELFLSAMNNVPYIVSKQETYYEGLDKKTRTITDKSASQACATRIDEIRDEFTEWARQHMQKNEELGQRMEQVYNERFNAIVPMEIDEQFTTPYLLGMNPNAFPLYPIQQKAIVRGTMQPVLLAHEVGTGKTRSLISTAMEMRRLGTAKKPMIVVQNATVMQFVNEAKELFPNAKVLTCNEKDRTSEGRREFYAKIKYNDWDMIVVPQSVFDMIPDSEERMRDFVQEKIDEKLHAIEQARAADLDNRQIQAMERELGKLKEDLLDANVSGKKQTKKDEKKEQVRRENAKTRAEEMLIRQTDDVADFDKMGIDALLVDEAHNYKHLGFATMMQRGVKGIDPSYSKRAAALYLKVQAVFEKSGGKNVVFATGTPISNTAAEIWTFMKYLLPKEVMKENEIYYFDDFVRNFGKISQSLEFATNGKFKENTRFASYVNIPELARIWGQITDTRLSDEVKTNTGRTLKEEKIPNIEGGKQTDIFLEQSESLVDIMNAVRSRLEEYENMSGSEKKENSHIPLTMYGIAKRAAIDPRLVDSTAADEPESKTNKAVEETLRALKESKKYNGTVAIFCDNYRRLDTVNGKRVEGFNIFEEIRNKLIAKGVPADQIVIMKSGMTDKAKQQVFDDMNAGTKRVILGSTQTLGTGVNIQTRLFTLIHMDAPDRPMDMTQREGRILRQGNMHKTMNIPVRILRFGVKDSLDVTGYQRLQTKSRFIDSIMRSKDTLKNNQEGRVIEEDEEGLYDNPVAVLSGSQYAMLKSQAEREYRKLLSKQQQHNADQVYIENQVRTNYLQNQRDANFAEESKKRLAEIEKHFPNGKKPKTIVFNGVKTTSAEALDKAIKEYNKQLYEQVERLKKGNYYGDERKEIRIPVSFDGVNFELFVELKRKSNFVGGQRQNSVDKALYYSSTELNIDKTPASNTVALAKLIEEITDKELTGAYDRERIAAAERRIAKRNSDNAEMEKRRGKQFGQTEELNAAKKRVDEYTELMRKELAEKEEKYANRGTGKAVGMDAVIDAEVENDDTEMRVVRKSKVQNVATEIWNKYQYDGELESMRDVAEYAEEHMPKNAQTQVLFDAIDAYRIEAEEDRMYYGMRGDLEPFEDAIMDEVERLMNATTQSKLTESEQLTFDALQEVAADAGLDVTVGVSQEEAIKKMSSIDTEIVELLWNSPLKVSVVSSEDGAKVLKNIETAKEKYKNEKINSKKIVSTLGKIIGSTKENGSQYARFETVNGQIITIRISDHNANVSNFDNHKEEEGISIVISRKPNNGITNDGTAHVIEFFYSDKKLNQVPGTPIADILQSLEQTLYSGEYKDTTGIAEVEEVNGIELLRNPINGTILGYAQGNRIVLTREGMNPETMVHEYTHIWAKAMQRKNRAGWENIKQIFRESPLWDEVVKDPNYQGLKTDDAICSEVLARYSGKYGAERLDEVAREMILEEQQSGSNLGAARVRALINRARTAIKSFWKWVGKNLFGITKFDSQEDVADRVLYDLLNATDLDAQNNEGAAEKSMERPSPEFVEAMRAWNAAHPYPTYSYGESLSEFSSRLNAWNEAREAYRRHLYEKATEEIETADPIVEPLTTEKPIRRKDETAKEYAQRLKLWQDGMIDSKLQEEYTAEMNRLASTVNQAKREFIDAALPIEEWQNWLVQRGAKINGDSNAYQDMFLAQGRVTDAADDMRRNIIQPLASKIGEIIDSKKLDSLELRWSNMDVPGTGRKIDGERLTPREIIGVYCQAKDCEEAEEKGLPDRGKDGFINNLGVSYDNIVSEVESRLSAAEVAELWDLIRKATKYALEYDYKSGRISEDTYNEFQDREYYVPQRGWRERDESGLIEEYEPVGKRGHDPYNAALVKARGRKTLAADPFAYIMSIDHSSIVSSENNKIKQKMLEFCLENEELGLTTGAFRVKKYWLMHEIDPDTGKILKDEDGAPIVNVSYTEPSAEEKKKDNQTKEQIKRIQKDIAKNKRQIEAGVGPKLETALKAMIDRWEKQVAELEDTLLIAWGATNTHISQRTRDEKMQHEVQVMKDGQRYVIELQDEKVANAINKRFKEHQQALFSVSDKIRNATRFMSAMLTQYNPEFAFSNFVRDYQVALATLLAENPKLAPAFVANFALCQRAVWAYAFNDRVRDRKKFVESDMGRYLQEYMASGAPTGFSYMQDLKSLRQDFDKMVNQGNVKRGIRAAAGMFALMTEWSETAVRFSAYVSARKAGWSVNDAAYMSKELTTNFDRAGEMADSGWMAWFSFFRATINGNIKFFRAIKKFPIAYSIIAAAYFAAGIANQFMNPNDPDDKVLASDFTRETNFVIGKWRIPVAHFMRIFFGAGVNMAQWMQGEKTFGHAVYNSTIGTTREILPNYTDVFGNFTEWSDEMGRVVPKEPKKVIRDVAPTFISPWVDVWTNRNFMGGTINREPFVKTQANTKDILMAKDNTLPIYKAITEGLYTAVGGDLNSKYKSDDNALTGLFDISGSSVQHIAEGYLTGGMDMVATTANMIYDAVQGNELTPDKMAFIRKFYNPYTDKRAYDQQYWLLKGIVQEYERTLRDHEENNPDKYELDLHSKQYQAYEDTHELIWEQIEEPTKEDVKRLMEANKQWVQARK